MSEWVPFAAIYFIGMAAYMFWEWSQHITILQEKKIENDKRNKGLADKDT